MGIDVRSEGVVWIVKRLLEIRASINYSNFPRFLDNDQIEYISDVAKNEIELNQLKIELTSIKNKRKLERLKNSNLVKQPTLEKNPLATDSTFYKTNQINSKKRKMRISRSAKTLELLGQLEMKISSQSETLEAKKKEERKINDLVDKVSKFCDDEGKQDANRLFKKLFGNDGENQELLDKITQLRDKIKAMEMRLVDRKEEAKKHFKKRFQNFKMLNKKYNAQYDLIQAALFGNNTVL